MSLTQLCVFIDFQYTFKYRYRKITEQRQYSITTYYLHRTVAQHFAFRKLRSLHEYGR